MFDIKEKIKLRRDKSGRNERYAFNKIGNALIIKYLEMANCHINIISTKWS